MTEDALTAYTDGRNPRTGDHVKVRRPYKGWSHGVVINTFHTDTNVRVQLDDTHEFVTAHVSDVRPI